MTDLLLNPQEKIPVSTFQRGYLGIILAVFCAFSVGSLALYKGLATQQGQAKIFWLKQALTDAKQQSEVQNVKELSPTTSVRSPLESFIEVKHLVPKVLPTSSSSQSSYQGLSPQASALHTQLIDTMTGKALNRTEDKVWFDAYWQTKTIWQDQQGQLWTSSPFSFKQQPQGDNSGRYVAKLISTQGISLPWLGLIFTALLSLVIAIGLSYFFAGQWLLAYLTPWSSLPFVTYLLWYVAQAEKVLGLELEGALVIPSIAFLPLVILGITQAVNKGKKSAHRVAYTYMLPTLTSVGLLVFVPFSLGVALSFMRHQHGQFEWVGLAHFIDILSAADYPLTHPLNFYFTLAVTIFRTLSNVFLHTSIGLALALLLNKEGLKLKGIYRALLIIPWAIPNYITALIWKGMFNQQYGLINQLLEKVGIESVSWMGSFWGAMAANISTNTWLGFPFMMVVTLGALQSIPTDLYEAARIAGASRWQMFKSITFPLLKPALLPAIILGSVWTFNMFNIIYLVSGGQPGGATDILITEAYRWAFEQDRYGYAAAYSLIIFFILLLYARLTQRLSQKAEEVYR